LLQILDPFGPGDTGLTSILVSGCRERVRRPSRHFLFFRLGLTLVPYRRALFFLGHMPVGRFEEGEFIFSSEAYSPIRVFGFRGIFLTVEVAGFDVFPLALSLLPVQMDCANSTTSPLLPISNVRLLDVVPLDLGLQRNLTYEFLALQESRPRGFSFTFLIQRPAFFLILWSERDVQPVQGPRLIFFC